MRKTKFDKIKEQQKKARDKEILYRVKKILKYMDNTIVDRLLEAVTQLHLYRYIYPNELQKLLLPGYKIVETSTGNEVKNNE